MKNTTLFTHFRQDLSASVVVFLVAVPLCLGIALASGAPLLSGLIAGIVGGIVVGSISGSSMGVSGPAAGLAVIVLTAIEGIGSFELFLLAVVLAGVLQVLMGLLKAGVVAYYFPSSVIKGMLSAIGIIIILKQIPHAFGYNKDFEGDFSFMQTDGQNTFSELVNMLAFITPASLIIALVCLAVLILWERPVIKKNKVLGMLPGPLLAVVLSIFLAETLGSNFGMTMRENSFVQIPVMELSSLLATLPTPDFGGISSIIVWKTAFTLAIVASLETLLCVEATDKLDPQKHITPTNRELIAQGVGNSISGLLGGIPVTQVIVRSSANIQSGGRSKLSAILHGIWILVAVLLIPTVMNRIPLACLAAILLVVGYKLAKPALFKQMYASGPRQFIPFIVTIIGVVFTDLLTGVMIGMAVGIFQILHNNYRVPFHFDPAKYKEGEPVRIELSEDVSFLNKAGIMRTLSNMPRGAHVVLDATRTIDLHPDVMEIIEDEKIRAEEQGITIEVIGMDHNTKPKLRVKDLDAQVQKVAANRKGERTSKTTKQ